ncbi:hypothetical protein Taro_044285 [Colocasia esculenta]|uniref:Uncharacterized protein n=1 Tax=Colocasia esculenta TaxID=4460 RepID=A0A843WTM8_COLES|nr:hypothetical protein [Colocasia esculenta]
MCPRAGFALRTFWWGTRQVTTLRSVTEGDTFVAVSWQRCQEGRVCLIIDFPTVNRLLAERRVFRTDWWCSEVLARPCVPLACWACRGLQANGSAWFLLCLPRLFARCLAFEGLSRLEALSRSSAEGRQELGWRAEGVDDVSSSWLGCYCCDGTGNSYWALFARLTPLLPSAMGSSSRELGVGRVAEAAVAPCVVSSSESKCCELLYLSELRVVLCKFSGYLN